MRGFIPKSGDESIVPGLMEPGTPHPTHSIAPIFHEASNPFT
jgi:hypothetical protein